VSEFATAEVALIEDRLGSVRERIRAAGGGDHIRIVGVTKRHPVSTCVAALAAGLADLGENYVPELLEKHSGLSGSPDSPQGVVWHLIGGLQTNKVRKLVSLAGASALVIQTIDRTTVLQEVARRLPGASVLVQVDGSGLPDRSGCAWDEVEALVTGGVDAGLDVRGLMTVAAPVADAGQRAVEAHFRRLRAAADRLGLSDCSMGMSDDLESAVGAGSTMVRLGTALFGSRVG